MDFEASSVGRFLELVETIRKKWFPNDEVPWAPWFRGQQKAHWPLRPKLYRDFGNPHRRSAYKLEDEIREEFIIRAPALSDIKPANIDDWECYFLMQHHGAPTRLLDWTHGALIGLYFAVKDNNGFSDAAVWVLDPFQLNRQISGIDEVIPPSANVAKHSKELVDRWLPERFANKIVPLPKGPLAVYPTHTVRRISSQRSCFTIHGSDEEGLDKLARSRNSCLQRIIIPQSAMRTIRKELGTCGIDESTIFPDLDGLGRLICSWWKLDQLDPPHDGVYTRLAPSKVDKGGVGVFAITKIKKNSPLFQGDNEEMLWVDESAFKNAPVAVRSLYHDFSVFKKNRYGCPLNFNRLTVSWYINEPKPGATPNVYCDPKYDFYALRDIKAGEELTVEYSKYSDSKSVKSAS